MKKTRQKIRRGLLVASLLLLPVTLYYFSPALCLQGAASGVASGSVLVFAGLFVSALFLGRAFCGWACPMGVLQELTAPLRGRPVARRRLAARRVRLPDLARDLGGRPAGAHYPAGGRGVVLRAGPAGGAAGELSHLVLDRPVPDRRPLRPQLPGLAGAAPGRAPPGLPALRRLHPRLPHEYRRPGERAGGRPGDHGLHPVRLLRGRLPAGGDPLFLQQGYAAGPGTSGPQPAGLQPAGTRPACTRRPAPFFRCRKRGWAGWAAPTSA